MLYMLETPSWDARFGLHSWCRPDDEFISIPLSGYEDLCVEDESAKAPEDMSVKLLKQGVQFDNFCSSHDIAGRGRNEKKPKLEKVPDFWTTDPVPTVTEEFKNLIEKQDPGIHQFIPLETYIYGSDIKVDHTRFYLFICGRVVTFPWHSQLPEKDSIDIGALSDEMVRWMRMVQEKPDYQAFLETLPFWRIGHHRGTYFIRQDLLKHAQKAGLKGFKETSKGVQRDVYHVFY